MPKPSQIGHEKYINWFFSCLAKDKRPSVVETMLATIAWADRRNIMSVAVVVAAAAVVAVAVAVDRPTNSYH